MQAQRDIHWFSMGFACPEGCGGRWSPGVPAQQFFIGFLWVSLVQRGAAVGGPGVPAQRVFSQVFYRFCLSRGVWR